MIIYIGEGENDAIFISSVLEKHFDIKKENLENFLKQNFNTYLSFEDILQELKATL